MGKEEREEQKKQKEAKNPATWQSNKNAPLLIASAMLRSAGNALLPAALWLLLCSVRELRAEDDAGDGFEPDFHAGAHAHEEPIDPAKRAEMVD